MTATRDQIAKLLAPHIGQAMGMERANNIMQVMVLEPELDIGFVAREMLQRYTVPETVIQNIRQISKE